MRVATVLAWLLSLAIAFAVGTSWERLNAPSRSEAAMYAAMSEALREPRAQLRFARLSELLASVTPETLDAVVRAFQEQESFLAEAELRMVASAWANLDPEGAWEHVRDEWPQRRARRTVLSEIVYEQALRDPAGAVAAVRSLPPGDAQLHEEVAFKLMEGWAQSPEWARAAEYVAAMPRSALRQQLVSAIARELLQRDGPEAAIAWAESTHEGAPQKFRLVVFRKAARLLAQSDPEAAVRWLEEHEGADYVDGVPRIIATQWAESDPEAAFAWLLTRPPDDERAQALSFVFRGWVQREPERAVAWLEAGLPDPALDPIVDSYARWLGPREPEQAVAWAGRIEDPAERHEAWSSVGRDWYKADPEAAAAWLEADDLPVEVASAVRSPRPPRPGPRRRPPPPAPSE